MYVVVVVAGASAARAARRVLDVTACRAQRQQDLWEYMQIYMIAVWAGASGMCCVTCCLSLCLFGTSDDVVADPHAMDSSL